MTSPLRAHLEWVCGALAPPMVPIERFVLAHGTLWTGRSPTARRGKARECFMNAFRLSQARRLRYCEGIGFPLGLIPTLHAWCLDDADLVVDPTWALGAAEYMGVVVPEKLLLVTVLRRGFYGVLDSPTGPNTEMMSNWPQEGHRPCTTL